MKAKELRERSIEDLQTLESNLERSLFDHRFKNFTNRLDDTSLLRKTRRDLARVKTLLNQKKAAPQGGETPASLNKGDSRYHDGQEERNEDRSQGRCAANRGDPLHYNDKNPLVSPQANWPCCAEQDG